MISGVGYTSTRALAQAVGRSRAAIGAQLYRMTGRGSLGRGSYALRQLMQATGYDVSQLRRAARALNQKWKRLHPRGPFIITEEQRDELLVWLRHDYWAVGARLYCCLHCTTDVQTHRALGLCGRCYWQYVRKCRRLGLIISPCEQARAIVTAGQADKVAADALSRMHQGLAADFEVLPEIARAIGVDGET